MRSPKIEPYLQNLSGKLSNRKTVNVFDAEPRSKSKSVYSVKQALPSLAYREKAVKLPVEQTEEEKIKRGKSTA
jgi:hypothetical protein